MAGRQLSGGPDRLLGWPPISRLGCVRSEALQALATRRSRGFDSELYRMVMVQIFRYTRHNSINQAVAAFRARAAKAAGKSSEPCGSLEMGVGIEIAPAH
jgi:hypothetical protein